MRYLRLVTGCMDGRIRIWSLITFNCLREFRGNQYSDPILAICHSENSFLVSTRTNVLHFTFEPVFWRYDLPAECMTPSERLRSRLSKAANSPQLACFRESRSTCTLASSYSAQAAKYHHDTADSLQYLRVPGCKTLAEVPRPLAKNFGLPGKQRSISRVHRACLVGASDPRILQQAAEYMEAYTVECFEQPPVMTNFNPTYYENKTATDGSPIVEDLISTPSPIQDNLSDRSSSEDGEYNFSMSLHSYPNVYNNKKLQAKDSKPNRQVT
ncbi:unnamed protein product [Protopolystoma xenopodis]|uniref:Uncharacterized protein n=1 Tax=Protopolystoma xenopodis TaxID=117903 RepID=A0A3S5BAF2_9PLAT|nr:unnamed protein product [Protopolystoma xenopodis]